MSSSIECVYVHAFRECADGSEYCEPDANPDGWCAYERTANTEGGEFDVHEEMDSQTFEAALSWAEGRAAIHNCIVQVY